MQTSQMDHSMKSLKFNNCDKSELDKDIAKCVQLMCGSTMQSIPDEECDIDFATNESYINLESNRLNNDAEKYLNDKNESKLSRSHMNVSK